MQHMDHSQYTYLFHPCLFGKIITCLRNKMTNYPKVGIGVLSFNKADNLPLEKLLKTMNADQLIS